MAMCPFPVMNLQDKQHLTTTQNLTHLTHPKKTTFPTPQTYFHTLATPHLPR